MPKEMVHIYQRPNQGDGFIARFPTFQYRHTIAAVGGFDTASFSLAISRAKAETILSNRLGCRVHIYRDNPVVPIWEGFISRGTINAGGVLYTRSLDEMTNRVSGIHSNATASPTYVTAADNLSSQEVYGIKQGSPDNTTQRSGSANNLRDTILSQKAYPQSSILFNTGGGGSSLTLECLGYYHWLNWGVPFSTSATTRDISAYSVNGVIQQMFVTDPYPNADFIDTTLATVLKNPKYVEEIAVNSDQVNMQGGNATYWDVLARYCEVGDGITPFVAGVTPTQTDGTRKLYFKAANLGTEYLIHTKDARVRTIGGRRVAPYLVRPDRMALIADLNVGIDTDDGDPRLFYVSQVDYDAQRSTVQLRSSDDITAEGAFRLRYAHDRVGVRFGTERRRQR